MRLGVALLGLLGLVLLWLPTAPEKVAAVPASTTLRAAHNDTTTPFNVVSLPELIRHRHRGRDLRLGPVLERRAHFVRREISYRSDALTISGVLVVPTRGRRADRRLPVAVIAHGYRPPVRYAVSSGLVREQRYLARRGFVVLQPDYRNYGTSSRESGRFVARPVGYPEDLVNSVLALRRARLPFVDGSRIALLGRSMGGGVALQALVATPRLFDAATLYSPLSSLAADNYRRWAAPVPALSARVAAGYGTPAEDPEFWRRASVRHYLHRVRVPVQIHHGTADPVCPVRWSEATTRALRGHGKRVRLFEYPGQPHRFHGRAWSLLMHRTVQLFRAHAQAGRS